MSISQAQVQLAKSMMSVAPQHDVAKSVCGPINPERWVIPPDSGPAKRQQ